MSDLIRTFTERGDLAHLALFLWAAAASTALWFALRELGAAARRFDDFVRELSALQPPGASPRQFFEQHRIMTEGVLPMDNLHTTLAALRTETKSTKDHLTVFREFLAQLDQLQRQAPAKQPRIKLQPRRKPARRGRGS